ncbi:hypothetical protein R6Q59_009424 [Mikania micrantha]
MNSKNTHKINNPRKHASASSRKCKKHPKHEQSPGICSSCLRERLLKISRSSSRVVASCAYNYSSSSSSSSFISSISSSSGALSDTASPMHGWHASFLKLKKSKSIAGEIRIMDNNINNDQTKKAGFWSKLMHSRTMREMFTKRPAGLT